MIAVVGALLAVVLLVAPAVAADRDKPLVIGDKAPGLELGDQHGQPFALAGALGGHRFIVLAFYPKAFTGG